MDREVLTRQTTPGTWEKHALSSRQRHSAWPQATNPRGIRDPDTTQRPYEGHALQKRQLRTSRTDPMGKLFPPLPQLARSHGTIHPALTSDPRAVRRYRARAAPPLPTRQVGRRQGASTPTKQANETPTWRGRPALDNAHRTAPSQGKTPSQPCACLENNAALPRTRNGRLAHRPRRMMPRHGRRAFITPPSARWPSAFHTEWSGL
jgi:hypothetical protein